LDGKTLTMVNNSGDWFGSSFFDSGTPHNDALYKQAQGGSCCG